MSKKEALIISRRIIPAHQLASLMEENGFFPRVEYSNNIHPEKLAFYLSVLVIDIDDPEIHGFDIACRYLSLKPGLTWFALCSDRNMLTKQQAKSLMAKGFFFLTESGMELDVERGVAHFLQTRRKDVVSFDMQQKSINTSRDMTNIDSYQPSYA